MRLSRYSLLMGALLSVSLPISSVLVQPINGGKVLISKPLDSFFCEPFTPLNNTVMPTVLMGEIVTDSLPNSVCAQDLLGRGLSVTQGTQGMEPTVDEKMPPAPILTNELPTLGTTDSDGWRVKVQPYVTVPINTYGSATARGRTVDYHLSLGELLDALRVTGSARIEAWNGRLGLIFDGYYTSLRNVVNLQQTAVREPNFIDSLNWLLGRNANGKIQAIANGLDQTIAEADKVKEIQNEQALQRIRDKTSELRANIQQKAEQLGDLETQIDTVGESLTEERGTVQATVKDFQVALRELATLEQNKTEDHPQENNKLRTISDFERQKIRESIEIQDLRRINHNLEELRRDPSLGQRVGDFREFKDKLNTIQDSLANLQEKLATLPESEPVQRLKEQTQSTQAAIAQVEQRLQQVQDFAENRDLQQLNANSESNLQFNQGIYDFAVSYHIGEPASYELPEKSSGRPFPLLWFQPYAGIRLNSINLSIDETFIVQLSSTLLNTTQVFQQNFSQGKTWVEPLLGGKLGLQISDPMTLWIRGDASGFGLAGQTDMSWNLIFGADWWVNRSTSLQLAYRFYGINYQNGSGDSAFGFVENFNGPYLGATLHF